MPFPAGQAHATSGVQWEIVVAVLLAAGAGLYFWRRDSLSNASRGRFRQAAWCVALLVAAALLAASLYPVVGRGAGAWWPVIPAAAVLVVLLRPGRAKRILPIVLIVLGVLGILLVRHVYQNLGGGWYGVAHMNAWVRGSDSKLIVPQAYLFLLLGGWLGWRELRGHSAAAWLLLGRTAGVRAPDKPWGLLLMPLALAFSLLVPRPQWVLLAIPLVIAAVLVIRKWPRQAGQAAALGMIVFAGIGLLATLNWYMENVGPFSREMLLSAQPAAAAVTPAGRVPYVPVSGGTSAALFGLVAVTGTGMLAAYLETLLLLCFGGWLVPQTFPAVARLIGRSPDVQLTRRVQRLTESRAVAVDTAAADLRRLERDLHDGAQARLVALGMNLRAAEKLVHTSPDAAVALVAEAREASARALTELRELVRGVHPPVLADRGLADAVRALALDSPLQVRTDVDLTGRPPAPVETACYFAVAELLTNAAKHSGAREARISVSHGAGRLRIEVTDFGLGGADASHGSGLAGVEKRLATFDGILAISSPVGGPTIVVLEVPCALSSPRISSC
jgi:signal transduction histidine kinase